MTFFEIKNHNIHIYILYITIISQVAIKISSDGNSFFIRMVLLDAKNKFIFIDDETKFTKSLISVFAEEWDKDVEINQHELMQTKQ